MPTSTPTGSTRSRRLQCMIERRAGARRGRLGPLRHGPGGLGRGRVGPLAAGPARRLARAGSAPCLRAATSRLAARRHALPDPHTADGLDAASWRCSARSASASASPRAGRRRRAERPRRRLRPGEREPPFGHFGHLLRAVERHDGRPAARLPGRTDPADDRHALGPRSRAVPRGGRRSPTPHLAEIAATGRWTGRSPPAASGPRLS